LPSPGQASVDGFGDVRPYVVAVDVLTCDDVGGPAGGDQKPRARQNVVFELGLFIGTLSRARVIIIYEAGIELPSDLNGVLYIPLDNPREFAPPWAFVSEAEQSS
jgi:predicted nucleotide-binding protein